MPKAKATAQPQVDIDDEPTGAIPEGGEELDQVDIVVDPASEDEIVDPKPKKKVAPKEAAADLQKQLREKDLEIARERQKREDAEAAAGAANTRAADNAAQQVATLEKSINDKVEAAAGKVEAVKQQLKQAKANQDIDAEVELSDAMAEARYELNSAKWEQTNFGRWKTDQEKKIKAQPIRTAPAEHQFSPAEQVWIDAHPDYKTNKTFARIANSAAAEALNTMKFKQDSTEFFDYIEGALKESGHLKETDEDDEDPTSGAGGNKDHSTSTALPPNRSGNGQGGPVRPNTKYPYIQPGFKIPAEWVEAAKDQGFDDPREYANERLKIQAEDKGNA